jgi:elongation factor Ts
MKQDDDVHRVMKCFLASSSRVRATKKTPSLDKAMMFALRRSALPCVRVSKTHARSFAVSTNLIKDLRAQSGAPISECKKALEATSSLHDAMDWLRQHGAAKASSKVQGREAFEGLVGLRISEDGSSAALVKVSSETDFASRSATFVALVTHTADATLHCNFEGEVDGDAILSTEYDSKSVKQVLDEAIVAIRENLGIASALRMGSTNGRLVGYVHGRADGSVVAGTAAAVVHVVSKQGEVVSDQVLEETGKKLAMHVVAAKPLYLTPYDVPDDVLQKEKDILTTQVRRNVVFDEFRHYILLETVVFFRFF